MKKMVLVLENVIKYLSSIALTVIVGLVFLNVVLRYGFNKGITWSEELAVNLFVWVIFLGSIIAAWDNLHIKVDLFINKMPPKIQKLFLLIANILVLIGLAIIAYGGYKMVIVTNASISPTTGIPASYINISLVVSAVGMGLITIYQTYKTLRQ